MKFSEKEILRYHETIPHWRIKWLRIDLDPLYADKVYGLLKECYEAARGNSEESNGGRVQR